MNLWCGIVNHDLQACFLLLLLLGLLSVVAAASTHTLRNKNPNIACYWAFYMLSVHGPDFQSYLVKEFLCPPHSLLKYPPI